MPAMPRPSGKGKKIAYALLGKPANLKPSKSKKFKRMQKMLAFKEIDYVKGA